MKKKYDLMKTKRNLWKHILKDRSLHLIRFVSIVGSANYSKSIKKPFALSEVNSYNIFV